MTGVIDRSIDRHHEDINRNDIMCDYIVVLEMTTWPLGKKIEFFLFLIFFLLFLGIEMGHVAIHDCEKKTLSKPIIRPSSVYY